MTTLTTTGSEKLDEVIVQSGLQLQEAEEVKGNYLPFISELHQIKEQALKINFTNPVDIDEKIARDLRLKTVKIRTAAGSVKDQRKKIHLLKGNLEQAAFNLIKADCELIEESFTQVEKVREIAEKARKSELKASRTNDLQPYLEVVNPQFIDLENMSDEDFNKLLTGADLQIKARKEAEAKAETERLAEIEADKKRQEEMRIENERLKKEAEQKELQLKKEREEALAKQKAIEDAARIEREKAEQARIEVGEERKAIEVKAKEEREEAERISNEKLNKERAERAKIEDELKAKQDAEQKEKARIEKELKTKIEADKKAAKAPKKQKLNSWITSVELSAPAGLSDDETVTEILAKFEGFKKWALDKINSL